MHKPALKNMKYSNDFLIPKIHKETDFEKDKSTKPSGKQVEEEVEWKEKLLIPARDHMQHIHQST